MFGVAHRRPPLKPAQAEGALLDEHEVHDLATAQFLDADDFKEIGVKVGTRARAAGVVRCTSRWSRAGRSPVASSDGRRWSRRFSPHLAFRASPISIAPSVAPEVASPRGPCSRQSSPALRVQAHPEHIIMVFRERRRNHFRNNLVSFKRPLDGELRAAFRFAARLSIDPVRSAEYF